VHRSWLGKLVMALAFGRPDAQTIVPLLPARARKHLNLSDTAGEGRDRREAAATALVKFSVEARA
jgi:hypothetical protein